MSVGPGSRLGAYEIVVPIGAGGMGEVWRATDTTLGRDEGALRGARAPGHGTQSAGYAVSPDGRRFLVQIQDPRAIPTRIHVARSRAIPYLV